MDNQTMNFFNAFTTSFMIQLAWFYKKEQGSYLVNNYKSKLLPKLRNLGCVILSNLSDKDFDINSTRMLLVNNTSAIAMEIYNLIDLELINTDMKKFMGSPISHLNDAFFRNISSIFKVTVVIKYTGTNSPNKVIRENKRENCVGVAIKYDEASSFTSDFCLINGVLADPTVVGEPYYYVVEGTEQVVENKAENAVLEKMAEILKNYKLYMSDEDRRGLAQALMLDERFIELRNELLITKTCNHYGLFKIFECKSMHCIKCLQEELRDNPNSDLRCGCGKIYSQKDKGEALKVPS